MRMLCRTTDTNDGYNYATIDIDAERAKELLTLRPLWEQLQKTLPSLYCIEIFDATPEFYESVKFDNLSEDTISAIENSELTEVPTSGEELPSYGEQHSTCAETLKVTRSGVLWSANPKYGEGYFETQDFTWALLEEIAAQ